MPQFPNCEAKIAQLNELITADNSRQWLAVINSYYVNEDYVKDFVEKYELKLPILFDQDNQIYRAYDVYASPYQIKVNRQGVIESRSDLLH
jgi:peroxiredoxin